MNAKKLNKKIDKFFSETSLDSLIEKLESMGFEVIDDKCYEEGIEGDVILKPVEVIKCPTAVQFNSTNNDFALAA